MRVISVWTRGRAWSQCSGGESRLTGDGTADEAQDAGERDSVGVDVRGLGGLGDQAADRVVDQQPGPDLLVDQLG